ncbi:hypothetical protein ACFX19_044276 [Malus domestica]
MKDRGEHESSLAQVPLVATVKRDGEQHRTNHMHCNCGRQARHAEEQYGTINQHQRQVEALLPHEVQIQYEVQRLIAEQLSTMPFEETWPT